VARSLTRIFQRRSRPVGDRDSGCRRGRYRFESGSGLQRRPCRRSRRNRHRGDGGLSSLTGRWRRGYIHRQRLPRLEI